MSTPEGAADAAADRNVRQESLNRRAGAIAHDVGTALGAVSSADAATAGDLEGIEIPQNLQPAVDAYIQRALAAATCWAPSTRWRPARRL